jgi:hypothetical protein
VACVQKLTFKDVRPEDPFKMVEMKLSGLLFPEIRCVRSAMMIIAQLFDVLNTFTSPICYERMGADESIVSVYTALADREMFPA